MNSNLTVFTVLRRSFTKDVSEMRKKSKRAGAGRVKRVESAEPCSNFCLCSLNMHISDVLVAITVVTAQNRPWGV